MSESRERWLADSVLVELKIGMRYEGKSGRGGVTTKDVWLDVACTTGRVRGGWRKGDKAFGVESSGGLVANKLEDRSWVWLMGGE